MSSSGALTVYEKVDNPIGFCETMAKTVTALTGCTVDQGQALALTMLCERLTPLDFIKKYHIIQGRPTMRADAMLAEFRMNQGGKYKKLQRSPEVAEIEFTDREGETYVEKLTWEGAQESRDPWVNWKDHSKGLKDNWATPIDRKRMLWARLVSDSMRFICPEMVAGVYTPEEIEDVLVNVNGHAANGAAPRPTASQIIEQANRAAATAQATGDVATEGAAVEGGPTDDVVDAEFEPAAAAAEQTAASPEEARDLAATDDGDPTPGTITAPQRKEIEALLVELNSTPEQKDKILAKRQVKSFRSLSKEQAVEILTKLRDAARLQRSTAAANSGN
jgi:hypothetical protein